MSYADDQHKLLKGICLFTPHRELRSTSHRVSLSAGSVLAASSMTSNIAYLDGARVPEPEWRSPTDHEVALLWAEGQPAAHDMVGLFRVLDAETLASLRQTINSLWLMPPADSRIWSHPLMKTLFSGIESACAIEGPIDFQGITFDPPGLSTVSVDSRYNKFVGLHIDYWENKPVAERHMSRTRLCINIGTEDRHLLFVNIGLRQMLNLLASKFQEPVRMEEAWLIGQSFMNAFPKYPVTKLLVSPGEAYIAPTEYVLHDGCSAAAQRRTQHTAFRARFRFLGHNST